MNGGDLHPEQAFDALREGRLSPSERARLEAHCAQCSACMFELRWVEGPLAAAKPSAEDHAYGEAAFDNVLRATRRVQHVPVERLAARWSVRWGRGVAGVLAGTALGGLLFGQTLWAGRSSSPPPVPSPAVQPAEAARSRPPAELEATNRDATPQVPAPPLGKSPGPPPSAAGDATVTADAMLAAARRAHTNRQPARARELYRRVIERYATSSAAGAARVALARILQGELRQPRAALQLLNDYLQHDPQGELVEEALYWRALVLGSLGRKREAQASLHELVQAFPNSLYAAPARVRLVRELDE